MRSSNLSHGHPRKITQEKKKGLFIFPLVAFHVPHFLKTKPAPLCALCDEGYFCGWSCHGTEGTRLPE